jgi:lipoprotein-releasing system ATP-binding protein
MTAADTFRIEVRGLEKRFTKGGQVLDVLQGIDLDLEAGERVAIRGQSGSGKSTFLQILGTLDRPTRGTVRFAGDDVFARPARAIDAVRNRSIGFIFQFHHLLPDHSALSNVTLPALIAGQDATRARRDAAALLDRVGLGARLEHKPGELSGGEQQRVAIARALIRRPALVLADEPTGNLDPKTADDVFDMLLELNAEAGSTLVVVTHSDSLAERFPRRLLLKEGRFADLSRAGGPA